MRPEEIKKQIYAEPAAVFGFLREEDYETRLVAFDAYIDLLGEDEHAGGTISDFVEIVALELIPQMAESRDALQLAALSHILASIGGFAVDMANPSPLVGLIEVILSLRNHTNIRVATSAIMCLGMIFKAMPEEMSESRARSLLEMLSSASPLILQASAKAWGEICTSAPKKSAIASARMFELLQHEGRDVRLDALGFFLTLARQIPAECSFALPLLREIRDSDPDNEVAERASATIQAISR
ncbi:MAG TPA: hypothetical protein ENN07_00045 [candidate division Zixibacteria bacterium]|nr:hypothetical protein [candidate division Zixibacteria bacterium]